MSATELILEHWPIVWLINDARNPRKNNQAVAQMSTVITEFGFQIPVVVNSSGELVDGHHRVKAARMLGLAAVPVVLADTMLLTAQRTSWRARAVKIAPEYVVTIKRFQQNFPEVPVTLLANGQTFEQVAVEGLSAQEAA